jgi:predicted phage terminase large subunit-like protein
MTNSKEKSPNSQRELLDNALREQRLRLLRAELARRSFAAFVVYTCPHYLMGWVHEVICRELDAFLEGVSASASPRLMITMPPRHGKSELTSRRFPAYAFGRHPDIGIISTSYSADLSSRMNRDVQRIMDDIPYRELFPDVALSGKNIRTVASGSYLRNSDIFEIVGHGGSYRSAGVGGGITGMGGDILIIDDPLKDRAEADSPTIRAKVWDWYTSTLYTRLAPGGGILLIQTRWHMDDLAGRLLEAERAGEGDVWRCVNFPAIADRDEANRRAGEALHPDRYPLERLLAIKQALGSRDWEALYQQKPVPDGGAVFRKEWIHYWLPKDLPDRFEKLLISWDMTFKDSEDSDYVVGQVWGRDGARHFLLDQVRGRMGFTATLQAFRKLADKWPQALEKLVEDKANGPAVIDSLKHEVSGVIPVEPEGSKTARAHAVTPLFEAGNVYIPHPRTCPWASDYEAELLQFPAAAHDDQVDATTQALRRFVVKAPMRINPGILQNVNRLPGVLRRWL